MKKGFKFLFMSFVCVVCLIVSFGCSCSSPMKVNYTVFVGMADDNVSAASKKITVNATLSKKFREPADTPCYREMKGGGYVELKTAAEIQKCAISGDCYKKVDGKYQKISGTDVVACQNNSMNCYEYVEETYYKLIEDAEEIYECYDADGNEFEKATYNREEKVQLESIKVIDTKHNKSVFTSELTKIPSTESYSLLYEFKITNNESNEIYVKEISAEAILGGQIKELSTSKIKITLPTATTLNGEKYYKINSGSSITVIVQIRNLLTSDAVEKKDKDFNIYLPIVIK